MTVVVQEATLCVKSSYSEDAETASRVWAGLRRFLVADAVTNELYEDLETVLGEHAVRLARTECAAIADRLRNATTELVKVVPRLITPYSQVEERAVAEQMVCAVILSAERPASGAEPAHLVRFASAVLTLLDLIGEAAEV